MRALLPLFGGGGRFYVVVVVRVVIVLFLSLFFVAEGEVVCQWPEAFVSKSKVKRKRNRTRVCLLTSRPTPSSPSLVKMAHITE